MLFRGRWCSFCCGSSLLLLTCLCLLHYTGRYANFEIFVLFGFVTSSSIVLFLKLLKNPLVCTESMGGGTSALQEFDDDGVHDVDGWKHSSSLQHRHNIFSSSTASQCTSRGWEK